MRGSVLQRVHILTFQSLVKQHLAVQGSKYTFFYVAAVGTAAVEVLFWMCTICICIGNACM